MVDTLARTCGLLPPTPLSLDCHSQHDGPRLSYQPTHPRFNWSHLCPQPRVRPCVWQVFADSPLVQAQDWSPRFYSNITGVPVAFGVRADALAYVPRAQLL